MTDEPIQGMESPDRIQQFSGRRYINLESYKRTGEPTLTPVLTIMKDRTLYFRTGPRTGKVKRIRRNPRVRVVPCDLKGKPNGTWVEGEARIVESEELEQAMALFKKEYGTIGNLLREVAYRLMRRQPLTTFISIRLLPKSDQK